MKRVLGTGALVLLALVTFGCDPIFPKSQVHCQLGKTDGGGPGEGGVAICQFLNLSKTSTRSCVRVKVTNPKGKTFTSDLMCSGTLLPDSDGDGVTDAFDRCPEFGRHASFNGNLKGSFKMDAQGCPTTRMNSNPGNASCRSAEEERAEGPMTGQCTVGMFSDPELRQTVLEACDRNAVIRDGALIDDPHFQCKISVEEVSF